jgi:hypothetical protein
MNDDDRDEQHEFFGAVFGHAETCPKHPDNVAKAAGAGPAQVATTTYRKNYDAIFGRVEVGQA